MEPAGTLASRLKELRARGWSGVQVTQKQVADTLGTSAPLVSSWENASVVPPEERVRALARFFASPRSLGRGLLTDDLLTPDEERHRRGLIDELIALREKALNDGQAQTPTTTGALGGRFWHFPDSHPVMIAHNTLEPDPDGLVEEVHRPVFLRDDQAAGRPWKLSEPAQPGDEGFPQLEYDVALLARLANPLNLDATLTLCAGIFSRGSYGAVRALTDAKLRGRNEKFLYERDRDADQRASLRPFWMLVHVPVLGRETITPDLNRPFHRVRGSLQVRRPARRRRPPPGPADRNGLTAGPHAHCIRLGVASASVVVRSG